ncbi:MAG: polysaccharide deacetylase [Clostridiales bacterium]|nr:polysaccharide deacetylase [Clostridiales bacterium]
MNFGTQHLRIAIAGILSFLVGAGSYLLLLSPLSPLGVAIPVSQREVGNDRMTGPPPSEESANSSAASTTATTTTAAATTAPPVTTTRPTVPYQTAITTREPTYDPDADYLPEDIGPVPHYEQPVGTVYLTFDDGPTRLTPEILDILAAYQVKATFFVVGHEDAFSRSMYRRIAAEGHELAIHTYTHEYSQVYQSLEAYFDDFDRISDLLYSETGRRITQFRFPGGSSNTVSHRYGGEDLVRQIAQEAGRRGLTYHDWSVSSEDASGKMQTVEEVLCKVLSPAMTQYEPVILMHDVSRNAATRDALPQMIRQLSEAGYNFDTVEHRSRPCQHRHWGEEE